MKKLFGVMLAGGLLTLLVVAGTARAQMPGTEIRASIPFEFTVRGETLPAGEYELMRVTDEPDALMLRKVNGQHEHIVFETEAMDMRDVARKSELVFNKYGDEYFLGEVVSAGEQTGRELAPSHAERTLRREMAKGEMRPDTVTVALN
jgi:hypothetical protein